MHMIDDRIIIRAVSRIKLRSEQLDKVSDFAGSFVDIGIVELLDNDNHQILFGRRGTGKTHTMNVLCSRLKRNKGSAALFIDLRNVGTSEDITPNLDISSVGLNIFRDVMSRLHWCLVDQIIDREPPNAEKLLEVADNLISAIMDPVEIFKVKDIQSEQTATNAGGWIAEVGINSNSQLTASARAKSDDEATKTIRETLNAITIDRIHFINIASNINEILETLDIRYYLLIDEWNAVDRFQQIVLAHLLKMTVLSAPRVTVKIAALEARAEFSIELDGKIIGLELGADIFSAPHLDDFFVANEDEEYLETLYSEIIFAHLGIAIGRNYLGGVHKVSHGQILADRLFSKKALTELSRSAEGVVRDLMNIFILAFTNASRQRIGEYTGRIEALHVVESAYQWFERDKLQAIPSVSLRVLQHLEFELLGSKLIQIINSAWSILFLTRRKGAGNIIIFKAFQHSQRQNTPRPKGLPGRARLQPKPARKGDKPYLARFYQYSSPPWQTETII